jgi:hypothetical protein
VIGVSEKPLHVGVTEVDITPARPIPLAGFAARTGPFEGVDRRLSLRVFWFSVDADHALLVTADILWWPPERMEEIRAEIAGRWPVPADNIILHATHTHGGPQTSTVFTPSLGLADDAWINFLRDQLLVAVGAAWDARQPAVIERGRGTSHIGINRRADRGEDPEDQIDREVIVLRISTPENRPLAVLVHHACHPTTTGDPRVTSEFPGVMCEQLGAALGEGVVVGFLQGCCGDINPYPTRDRGTRPIGDADVAQIGEEIAADVARVLDGPLVPVTIDRIDTLRTTALLPVQHVPTVADLTTLTEEPGITGEWARFLQAHPQRLLHEIPVELTHLCLGDELGFFAMAAEVTTPYGLAIKAATHGRTLPLPYSNGMVGYVITDFQLAAGGYEAIESTPYFGLPSPFAPGIEAVMHNAIAGILEEQEQKGHVHTP